VADRLVTPEELASYLQTDTLDLATAELLIETATGVVQAAARQRLVEVTDTITVSAVRGSRWLVLPERPGSDVSVVTIDGTPVTDWSVVVDPGTGEARLFRSAGWWLASGPWSSWDAPPQVAVTYQHGFQVDDPKLGPARTAVLRLAGERWASSGGSPVSAESIDDYRVQFAASTSGSAAASPGSLSLADRRELRRAYGTNAGSTVVMGSAEVSGWASTNY
jgi:hypothetical protein